MVDQNQPFYERSEYLKEQISEYWERFLGRETRTTFLKSALRIILQNKQHKANYKQNI